MNDKSIPTYQFSSKYLADMPFQILQFADLPQIAIQPFPRRRTFYEVFWIKAGSGIHHIDFEEWQIKANTLHIIKPNQVTFWEIQQEIQGYVILFTAEFIATTMLEQINISTFDFFHEASQHPLIHINNAYIEKVNTTCAIMISEYQHNHHGRFALLQSQLITLLIYAQRHYVEAKPASENSITDKLIFAYRQLIEEHFHEVKTIQAYADMLNVTSGHLRDMTREKLGVTPSELLNKRIILECKRLLTHSDKTIAQIAHHLQFDDPSYFTRFFKRETGTTPTTFKQHILEKYQHPHE